MSNSIKVLYIAGWGRSGSTVLDNLLGELDGFFSGGELHYFWERGLLEGRKCGCGKTLESCEVWSKVLVGGGADRTVGNVDARKVLDWQDQTVRVRHTPTLLRADLDREDKDSPVRRYAEVLGNLYEAVTNVSGARVIVDSSKRPSDGAFLRLLPSISPYYVHLVRDPRAVAYSWRRRKAQLDREGPAELRRHGVADSTLSWTGWNLGIEALRRTVDKGRSILVRYEDFVAAPRKTVIDIARMVGEEPVGLSFEDETTAFLSGNHTTSGNPSRFKTGRVRLRTDDEWLRGQSGSDRWTATLLAAPLLRRYGYPLIPDRRSDDVPR